MSSLEERKAYALRGLAEARSEVARAAKAEQDGVAYEAAAQRALDDSGGVDAKLLTAATKASVLRASTQRVAQRAIAAEREAADHVRAVELDEHAAGYGANVAIVEAFAASLADDIRELAELDAKVETVVGRICERTDRAKAARSSAQEHARATGREEEFRRTVPKVGTRRTRLAVRIALTRLRNEGQREGAEAWLARADAPAWNDADRPDFDAAQIAADRALHPKGEETDDAVS